MRTDNYGTKKGTEVDCNKQQSAGAEGTMTRTGTSGFSGSTTTKTTPPGVFIKWTDEELDEIAKKYIRTIGTGITPVVGAFLKKCMFAGMSWLVVLDAIEKTGWARNPTAYYLRAILNRYLSDGIRTLDDVRADEKEREIEKRTKYLEKERDWFY